MVNITRNEKFLLAFGKNLRKIRKSKGMTMEAVAFEAGIEYRQLGRIERGEINTTISSVFVIANAHGIELPELFQL